LSEQKSPRYPESSQLSHLRMKHYFENAQRTCDATTHGFVGLLKEKIDLLIKIPASTQIRNCENKEEKIAMWEAMKIKTFARTISGIYGLVLLALHLRLQVNVVGRYLYLDTILDSTGTPQGEPAFGPDTQTKYLAYADYLLQSGLPGLSTVVEVATEAALKDWLLTRIVGYDDTLRIILDIRRRVEGHMDTLLSHLLPSEEIQDSQLDDPKLVMLLSETRNILESDIFRQVLKVCLDQTFLYLTTHLRDSFVSELNSQSPSNSSENSSLYPPSPLTEMAMAKFIPIINKQFGFVLENTSENEVVDLLSNITQLQNYSFDLFTASK